MDCSNLFRSTTNDKRKRRSQPESQSKMTKNAGKLSPHLCTPAVRRSLAVVIAASASGAAGLEHGKAIASSTKERGCDADRDPATFADDGLYTDDVSSAAAADSATATDEDQQQPTAFLTTSEARAKGPTSEATANIVDLVPVQPVPASSSTAAAPGPAAPAPSSGDGSSSSVAGGGSELSWNDLLQSPLVTEAEKVATKAVGGRKAMKRVEQGVEDFVDENSKDLKEAAGQLIKTNPGKILDAIEDHHPGFVKKWQRLANNPGAALDKLKEEHPDFAAALDKVLDHPRAELKKIAKLHPEIWNNAKKALEDPRAALDWLADHHPNATAGILDATAKIMNDPAKALNNLYEKHPEWVKEVENYAKHPGAALDELKKNHPNLMQELIQTILFPTPSPASPPDGTTAPDVADASIPAPTTAAGAGFEATPVAEANFPNPAPQDTPTAPTVDTTAADSGSNA